jgi:threonine synthase
LRILVATSGDTGGAVAAAFHNRPGFEVVVLFPKGLVSPTQQHQLTCWGGNVRSFAVNGSFDDCQRLVKAAFADARWRERHDLSSANSINLGRLLPQMTYFAWSAALLSGKHEAPVSFIVPSGNLGHATACVWARKAGMAIDKIVLAHNSNRTMPDFLETGDWRVRASVPTLASAMDVGDPSNAERLRHLFPSKDALALAVSADVVDDACIRARIKAGFDRYGQVWCPHTAVGMEVFERRAANGLTRGPTIVAATAHAAKFAEIVEPIVGSPIAQPAALARLFDLPVRYEEVAPDLGALWERLGG